MSVDRDFSVEMTVFKMKKISVFDTAIASYNLGNEIIMEAIRDILFELFPNDFLFSLPWEGDLSKNVRAYMKTSDLVFFGGTNSLASHLLRYKQFGFRWRDLMGFKGLILCGVGWWQYQGRPDVYTKVFLKKLLSKRWLHSVRDEYTKNMLMSIGIDNVVNTCCPTTWRLTPAHCSLISEKKSNNVVVTLTDYNKNRRHDELLLKYIARVYENIYFWVQGVGDIDYINSFDFLKGKLRIVPPRLVHYDRLLERVDCDYIGTRLHAGIRAIQKKRRALIIAVDNRAAEISRDIGLNMCGRDEMEKISAFVEGRVATQLRVPFDEIARWKAQFA